MRPLSCLRQAIKTLGQSEQELRLQLQQEMGREAVLQNQSQAADRATERLQERLFELTGRSHVPLRPARDQDGLPLE